MEGLVNEGMDGVLLKEGRGCRLERRRRRAVACASIIDTE